MKRKNAYHFFKETHTWSEQQMQAQSWFIHILFAWMMVAILLLIAGMIKDWPTELGGVIFLGAILGVFVTERLICVTIPQRISLRYLGRYHGNPNSGYPYKDVMLEICEDILREEEELALSETSAQPQRIRSKRFRAELDEVIKHTERLELHDSQDASKRSLFEIAGTRITSHENA